MQTGCKSLYSYHRNIVCKILNKVQQPLEVDRYLEKSIKQSANATKLRKSRFYYNYLELENIGLHILLFRRSCFGFRRIHPMRNVCKCHQHYRNANEALTLGMVQFQMVRSNILEIKTQQLLDTSTLILSN